MCVRLAYATVIITFLRVMSCVVTTKAFLVSSNENLISLDDMLYSGNQNTSS